MKRIILALALAISLPAVSSALNYYSADTHVSQQSQDKITDEELVNKFIALLEKFEKKLDKIESKEEFMQLMEEFMKEGNAFDTKYKAQQDLFNQKANNGDPQAVKLNEKMKKTITRVGKKIEATAKKWQ